MSCNPMVAGLIMVLASSAVAETKSKWPGRSKFPVLLSLRDNWSTSTARFKALPDLLVLHQDLKGPGILSFWHF